MIFGEILGFGDFGGNPGVWFLVLPTNYVYTTYSCCPCYALIRWLAFKFHPVTYMRINNVSTFELPK